MLKESILYLHPPVIRFCKCYNEGRKAASRSLTFIQQSTLDKKLFGNPLVISEYEYEQEKVETLGAVFKRVSAEEAKCVIDDFVDFAFFLYNHSLIEKNFNIASNFGRNAAGEIILIDLGEICTSETEIKQRIAIRAWSTADVLAGLPTELRAYFIERLDATFQSKS